MIQECIIAKDANKPVGPYSPALKTCDFMYISGQLPVDPTTGTMPEDVYHQTLVAIENMEKVLEAAEMDLSHVMKTTVVLTDMNDFKEMNRAYAEKFKEPYPARMCFGVTSLVGGAKVEIDGFAIDTRAMEVLCCGEGECTTGCECCGE